MILQIYKSDDFFDDLLRQVDWYRENANSEVAERFVLSVQVTLEQLSRTPTLGRPRFTTILNYAGFDRIGLGVLFTVS